LGLFVFSPREFVDIFKVPKRTASSFISKNLKSGLFIKIRNNYYTLKDSYSSPYFIANKIYQPSYISLEKALSYYNIIPETVYTITSVTTKPTREFNTPKGIFSYQKIKKRAFTGYGLKKVEENKILIAEPEKALADFLYFVSLKKQSLNDRFDLKKINKRKLIKYANLFERNSVLELIKEIYD